MSRDDFSEHGIFDRDDWPEPARPAPAAEDDASEPIRVVLDEHGIVTDVVIPENWRDTMSAHQLGPALLEATNKAMADRVSDQLAELDIDAALEQPVRQLAPSRPDAPKAGDPTSDTAEALVAEVLTLFSRYDAELAAYASQVREVATATSTSGGVNGAIEVTMTGGRVTGVQVDRNWASRARYTEIRAEALSAFEAARRRSAQSTQAVALPPSIARLQELASDPQALSRQLGLAR